MSIGNGVLVSGRNPEPAVGGTIRPPIERSLRLKNSIRAGVGCLVLLLSIPAKPLTGQGPLEEATGFGGIGPGAPVSTLPFSCEHPVSCEGVYQSVRIRVWHAYGQIQRLDVVYSGKNEETGEAIRSTPITLAQAVRSHSIRYGRSVPRLGFGGSSDGARIIVDYANGIAYFADTAFVTSPVNEVRYLPMGDPIIITSRASPLSEHGEWLMKEARFAPRYKNLLAGPERAQNEPTRPEQNIHPEEVARRLEKVSLEARVYAQATLMLSARVLQSLEDKQAPDPVVSARLRKTYARLNATTNEALCLINHHPGLVTALPLEMTEEAQARMKQLASEGFEE